MDIQQLRSWIFELFEPLRNERTYILLHDRDGILIDVPPYSDRVAKQIRGVCDPRLIFFTHAARAAEVERWRAAFPEIRLVAHQADASRIAGGVQHAVADGEILARDPVARVVHVGTRSAGHAVILVGVPGGVLVVGDLLTATPKGRLAVAPGLDAASAREGLERLRDLRFSAVLSETGAPIWNAGRERALELLNELPRRRTRFGHILDAPWDPAYIRVKPQMSHNPIVPVNKTIAESAGQGPSTLVTAWEGKPARDVAWPAAAKPQPSAAAGDGKKKWSLAKETAAALPAAPSERAQSLPWELAESPVAFRALSAAELAAVPHVDWLYDSFDLSRDGRDAVFAWDRSGTFEIYRAPVSGDEIFQLTSGAGRTRSLQPRISPDGRNVAFLRDTDTDERFDVFLVDREGRGEQRLTTAPATRTELAWAPDSRSLAYVSDEAGRFALRILDVASRTSRAVPGELRFIEDLSAAPAWSHDGRFIAFHSGDADGAVGLSIVAADGSAPPRRLDTSVGGATGQARSPAWSPDDRQLAFATDARGRWEIAVLPMRGGAAEAPARFLREGRFDETAPVWDADPRRLLYRRVADAQVSVRRAFLVSNDDEPALDAPGTHFLVGVRPDGGLVYHWSSAREPADVWMKGARDVLPHRLSRSLPSSLEPGLFVEPRHVRYRARDGAEVPALLYLPHREAVQGEGRPPAVVVAHGGPTSQHFVWFDEWIQWYANRGYAVLAPNVRGSTGYGRAFREADRGDIGGKDVDDVVAGAEWLASEGVADGERIAVHGASYGGYLALLSLARAPKRFAAGVSLAGLTSLAPFFGEARADVAGAVRLYVEGLDESEQRERSPLELVDRITAPVLVLQGKKDPRVPVGEAERFVEALRKRGKAFSYHAYDAGHLLLTRDDRRDAFERAIEFVDEHVREPRTAVTRKG